MNLLRKQAKKHKARPSWAAQAEAAFAAGLAGAAVFNYFLRPESSYLQQARPKGGGQPRELRWLNMFCRFQPCQEDKCVV